MNKEYLDSAYMHNLCINFHLFTSSFLIFFFILVCEAIGTAATSGLLCQPRGDSEDDGREADGM
jgi:hypothetical protein